MPYGNLYYYVSLLVVVVIIAIYVNRKRDAKGNISFVDKNTTGTVAVRLSPMLDSESGKHYIFPLWVPENHLLLNIRKLMTPGAYGIDAIWDDSSLKPSEYLFTPDPEEKGVKRESLTDRQILKVSKPMIMEFRISVESDRLCIDSPQKQTSKTSNAEKIFPLIIDTPEFARTAKRLKKAGTSKKRRREIWNLTITDDGIIKFYDNEIRVLKRKLEGLTVKNRELATDLNRMVKQSR